MMYQSLEASLHDLFWHSEEDADEMPLLENFLNQHAGTSLEVGCGSGRLLLPLIEKNFDLEGVELSGDMLDLLKQEATKKHLQPTLHHYAIEEFSPDKTYASIVVPAFTLQLLSRDIARRILRQLRAITKEQGGLYLTLFIPWAEILDELEIDTWHLDKEATLPTGQPARCFTKHSIQRLTQELHREHRYETSDSTHLSQQTLQWYFLPEIINMLENGGWEFQSYHADFTLGNQDPDASVFTVFATASSAL